MTPDENKKRIGAKTPGDQFVDGVRDKLARHLARQKKKGIEPKPGKLTIIQMPRKEGAPDWRQRFAKRMDERKNPPLPGPHPTKLIDALVRDYLSPYLKGLGFRKKARRLWKDHGEVVDVITVRKYEYNDAWEGGFAVELGVYWKKHQDGLGYPFASETMPPDRCLLNHRLSSQMDKINDRWWKFKPNVDLRALADEVIADLESQGLSWLKSRHDPKYIRELIDQKGEHLRRVAKVYQESRLARLKINQRRS